MKLTRISFRYLQALSTHRLDGHLQRRIGEVIDMQGDKSDAIQYYFDVRIFSYIFLIKKIH